MPGGLPGPGHLSSWPGQGEPRGTLRYCIREPLACAVLVVALMSGINKVNLLGNLGSDPELKMTAGGNAVLKLSVATNEVFTDKNGAPQERVEWHRVTVFGKQAEGLARFVRKGWRVFVEGRIEYSTYEKDGQKHHGTDIVAVRIHALAPPSARSAEEAESAAAGAPSAGGRDRRSSHARTNGGISAPGLVSTAEIPF